MPETKPIIAVADTEKRAIKELSDMLPSAIDLKALRKNPDACVEASEDYESAKLTVEQVEAGYLATFTYTLAERAPDAVTQSGTGAYRSPLEERAQSRLEGL